jgi:hypothetical protein
MATSSNAVPSTSIENASPVNNHKMNENQQALETPKINESVLAKLDKVGAHFKYVQMFRKLKAVVINDHQYQRSQDLLIY